MSFILPSSSAELLEVAQVCPHLLPEMVVLFLSCCTQGVSWLHLLMEAFFSHVPSYSAMCVHVQSLSHVQLFETLWTVAHQVPLPMGFSSHEYCSGFPFPSPGDVLTPGGVKPASPVSLQDTGSCISCRWIIF